MKHRIISFLLALVILSTSVIAVAAASEGISPRFNHTASASSNFVINSSGKATLSASYDAYQDSFTDATVISYIEKRTLGLFWTKVDIGEPDDEWVDTSTDCSEAFIHTVQLKSTGTYRATILYEINGKGGAADTFDYEQERTYS